MMRFRPLSARDMDDLAAVNADYLRFLASGDPYAVQHLQALPVTARERLRRLDTDQTAEAARCPFLLCGLHRVEIDLETPRGRNLELIGGAASGPALVLLTTLSLLRRIGRRRPFAVRVVAGTGMEWCKALVHLDDPAVVGVARRQASRLRPVHAGVRKFWPELLSGPELSPLRRRAIRAAGLQLLQMPHDERPMAAAASRIRVARRRREG